MFLSNGWQEEKEGKKEIQKFEYRDDEKSFLNEIFKSIFRNFLKATIL